MHPFPRMVERQYLRPYDTYSVPTVTVCLLRAPEAGHHAGSDGQNVL
jgi:hypothetical protein